LRDDAEQLVRRQQVRVRLLHGVGQLGNPAARLDGHPGPAHHSLDNVERLAAGAIARATPGGGEKRAPALRGDVGADAEAGHAELTMQEVVDLVGASRELEPLVTQSSFLEQDIGSLLALGQQAA
jgi:hypothetical protein